MSNWVDVAILGILAWNVADGVRRGFVGAAVDLAVFLLSVSAAVALNMSVAHWATETFGIPSLVVQPLTFLLVWVLAAALLATVGAFITGPFQFLLAGSALDRLLSVVPSVARGLALLYFAVTLVVTPPPFLAELSRGALSDIRGRIEDSALGPILLDGMSIYDRWVLSFIGQTPSLISPPVADQNSQGSDAVRRILPGNDRAPLRREGPPQEQPTAKGTPTTGQGFPPEIYEALDLLDRAGNHWVRDTVSRWVTDIRFVGGGGTGGHLPGTGYFARTDPTQYIDGVYYSDILVAESQRRRDRFLAGWLAHEATHVLQSNTDINAYKDCLTRESQAYLLQGYTLLDLFGGDLEAIRRARGVYPDEIRYATASKTGDIATMVRYILDKPSLCRSN